MLVDIVTAASVDVISAATERFEELRIEAGGRAGVFITPEIDLSLSFTHSAENDWISISPAASLAMDLAERNTQVAVGYGFVHNQVGRANDPTFEQRLLTHSGEVALTQIIDRATLAGVSYTGQLAKGWQSSPYRYVRAAGSSIGALERHPESRLRHAIVFHGLRSLGNGAALGASYRFYGDDWGVFSHTLSTELRLDLSEAWGARVRVRGYYQDSADFWRERYTEPLEFMSADRELATFFDVGGGVKIHYESGPVVLAIKVDGQYYHFLDVARISNRLALIADVGGGVRW